MAKTIVSAKMGGTGLSSLGTAGQVLKTNSGATALEWSTPATPSSWYVQSFDGDGSTVAFTLSQAPASENNTQVYISGVYQQKSTYSVSGTTLTFSEAPSTGTGNIEVATISTSAIGTTTSDLVTFSPDGTGAIDRSAQAKLRDVVSVKDFGAVGDGSEDDTAAIQAALDASNSVTFPSGEYKLTAALVLDNDASLLLDSACQITQATSDKEIFKATSKDNIFIKANGAVLYGEGTWSGEWTGNTGHYDIAVNLINCTRSVISHPHIKNCGHSGIRIEGGSKISILSPVIEGTSPSSATTNEGNFQHGIYLAHHETHGLIESVSILHPDISLTGQGILLEVDSNYSTLTNVGEELVSIDSPLIYDITGQHGIYAQSTFDCSGAVIQGTTLAGIKIQSGSSNYAHRNFNVSGFSISDTDSQAIEVATTGTGSLNNLSVSGVATNCNRGISISKNVAGAYINLVCYNSAQYGAVFSGDNLTDIELHILSRKSGRDGVLVSSTNSSGLRIFPKIQEANDSEGASYSGVRIESATATTDIFNMSITDTNGRMYSGVYNEGGSSVGIHGPSDIDNALTFGMRTAVAWRNLPTELTITNTPTKFHDLKLINSLTTVVVDLSTSSSSNATLWARTLDDESAILVQATLTGKKAGSAERRGVVTSCLAYRDGGADCVVEGTDDDVDITSSSFNGAFSWQANGTSLRFYVNSGSSDTYDWVARITVTPVSD